MIRLWAEVYDATYTTQIADSDVLLSRASIQRKLDGPAPITIETPVLHVDFTSRALSVLTVKRVVEVWYQESEAEDARRVGAFVIERVQYTVEPGGVRLSIHGVDTFSLLGNFTTSLNLSLNASTMGTAATALLPSGWSYTSTGGTVTITARFDGTSVLKALQEIVKTVGLHMRQSLTLYKQIQFGPFGDDSGYRVAKVEGDHDVMNRDPNVIPIRTIDITTDASEIVNKVIPLSAGDGDARGTLEDSTRTSPYTIQTEVGPDGRTIYYISDSTSVTAYSEITKVLNFKKIAPISVSATALQRTANYLYDGASEWLDRHKDPLTTLSVRVAQQRTNLRPGDKVRVEYVDQVNVAGTPIVLQDINALYWVMETRESYGEDGEDAGLTLVSVDRVMEDLAEKVIEAVDSVDVYATGYKTTLNIWSVGPIIGTTALSVTTLSYYLNIPDDVLRVTNVTLVINTYADRDVTFGGDPVTLALSNFGANTDFPEIDIDVNSTSVATGLGSTTAALTNYEIDVTDEILAAGNDGRGDHLIEVTATDGSGTYGVQFLIRGEIVPGKV